MKTHPLKKRAGDQRLKIALLFVFGVLLISVAILLFIPDFKADPTTNLKTGLGVPIPGSGSVTNFYEYITAIVNFCSNTLGPIIAVAMIVIGGYRYIFAQGDSTAMTQAKDTIWGAIFGYMILFLLKFIVNVIGI